MKHYRLMFYRSAMILCLAFYGSLTIQSQDRFFPDSIVDRYLEAFDQNEQKDYYQAYSSLKKVDRDMAGVLASRNESLSQLPEQEFLFPYWTVQKSLTEIAYKLGLAEEMKKYIERLTIAYDAHHFENKAQGDACLTDIGRMEANRRFLLGDYDMSEKLYRLSLNMKGQDYDFEAAVRNDLAQLYYKQGLYEKALCQLDTILSGRRYGDQARVHGSENTLHEIQSQRAICLARLGKLDEAGKLMKPIMDYYRKTNDAQGLAEALRKSAKIMMLRYDATGTFDKKALAYYREYLSISRKYIDENFVKMSTSEREQYWLTEQPFATDCYRLENKDAGLLYDVALYSKAVLLQMGKVFKPQMTLAQRQRTLGSIRTSWKSVQASMPVSSAAIEFVTYEKKGKEYLGGIVLNKSAKAPIFVEIISLDSFKNHLLDESLTVEKALVYNEDAYKNKLYSDSWVRNAIWTPSLIQVIGKAREVYFAADGILHQLAVEYLLPQQLAGKKFYRMTSTRLLKEKRSKIQTDRMLLCGGVDYSFCVNPYQKADNDQVAYYKMASDGLGLPYLRGSLVEIDSIARIREGHQDLRLSSFLVTEKRMRQKMSEYPILHVATHGYFADSEKLGTELVAAASDSQLSNSCLFLSGAERNMQNTNFDPEVYDGILSAREIASLDLSKVNLVVLSACQSGQGYLTLDGIFGLQRGLKTAGVRAIIASLWNVDDEATAFLMKTLYANLEKGKSLYEAFSQARETLKKTTSMIRIRRTGRQLPDTTIRRKFEEPQYTDAFILIDGNE